MGRKIGVEGCNTRVARELLHPDSRTEVLNDRPEFVNLDFVR